MKISFIKEICTLFSEAVHVFCKYFTISLNFLISVFKRQIKSLFLISCAKLLAKLAWKPCWNNGFIPKTQIRCKVNTIVRLKNLTPLQCSLMNFKEIGFEKSYLVILLLTHLLVHSKEFGLSIIWKSR